MFSSTLSSFVLLAALSSKVYAQGGTLTYASDVPLASKVVPYNGIPYQVDPFNGVRGAQSGYNLCNSTTENQNSLCQTSFLNSIDDFCLWAPAKGPDVIGNTEGEEVAWCMKPGHGTRVIPPGALTGVQFMKAKSYVQVVGFIDQTKLLITDGDLGGELDPHGADLRGNPLGGLMYSNAWSGGGENYEQVIEWNLFIGGNAFCFKACDPKANTNGVNLCENRYDETGCAYNMPNAAQNNQFVACEGEDQLRVGVYVENGQTMTWTQGQGEPPYTPVIPASSNCVTYTSSVLYASAITDTNIPSQTPTGASGGPTNTPKPSGASTGSGAHPSNTAGGNSGTGAASGLVATGMTSLLGAAFAVAFFA